MGQEEKYVNQAFLSVTESGANTLTFSKLETGISIYEKVGWLINRIDYSFEVSATVFAAAADRMLYGISVSQDITNVDLDKNAVIDSNSMRRYDFGTAGIGALAIMPITKDFSSLPGGGLLVPPNPIFIYAQGVALTPALTVQARMFYTVIKLKLEDFWELVEQRRMIGA